MPGLNFFLFVFATAMVAGLIIAAALVAPVLASP
jgi:hypothetical protein